MTLLRAEPHDYGVLVSTVLNNRDDVRCPNFAIDKLFSLFTQSLQRPACRELERHQPSSKYSTANRPRAVGVYWSDVGWRTKRVVGHGGCGGVDSLGWQFYGARTRSLGSPGIIAKSVVPPRFGGTKYNQVLAFQHVHRFDQHSRHLGFLP